MTMGEAGRRYGIPKEILQEYERWGLCGVVKQVMGKRECGELDLERLSLIMTLHDIGFSAEEVELYMRLSVEGRDTGEEQLRMLDRKRRDMLDEIHFQERKLDRLDYLRHQLRCGAREGGD